MSDTVPRVAYVVSEYPKVSHTFVMREVEALRRLGVAVDTVSIRRTPEPVPAHGRRPAAAAETFAVLPAAPADLVTRACSGARPPSGAATRERCGCALRFGAPGARNRLWQLFYFAEAVARWREQLRRAWHRPPARALRQRRLLGHDAGGAAARPPLVVHDARPARVRQRRAARASLARSTRAAFVACISDFCRAQLMRLVSPDDCGPAARRALRRRAGRLRRAPSRPASASPCEMRVRRAAGADEGLRDTARRDPRARSRSGERVRLTIDRRRSGARAAGGRRPRELPEGAVVFTGALGRRGGRAVGSRGRRVLPAVVRRGRAGRAHGGDGCGLPVVATRSWASPSSCVMVRGSSSLRDARTNSRTRSERSSATSMRSVSAGEAGRAIVETHFDVRDSAATLLKICSTARGSAPLRRDAEGAKQGPVPGAASPELVTMEQEPKDARGLHGIAEE